ncbi:Protein YdgA [Pseudomonas fluorescens]|nr:Protein YdgA [Pseudomonas fluorescens]
MKKITGVLSGLVIAIAAVATAGAWYTGKQLPAELDRSLAVVNQQLKQALIGSGGSMTIELVSLDQHLFTSTAHYRLKGTDIQSGGAPVDFEAGVVDTLEHGPFPWSRVKALKLMPVMVASNAELQKGESIAAWFAAAGEQSPLRTHFSMGYGGSVDGKVTLLPLRLDEADGNKLDFSGLELRSSSDRDGKNIELHGTAGKLDLTVVGEDHPPVKMLFRGLSIDGDLTSTGHAMVYGGSFNAAVAESQLTLGPQQDVAVLKGLEVSSLSTVAGDKMDGRIQYKLGGMTYNGRAVGSGEMVFSMKRYDIPAFQSLMEWYATKLPQVQAAQAAGVPFPELDMTEQERTKVHADLAQLLSAKPQFALENLSFKTANGESRLNLTVDLANPSSFDLPPDQLGKQLVSQVQGKLTLSKPMIGDLATLQALLQNQGDPQAIAQQAGQAGEMVGMMAVQSGLATVQGNDVVASLHYADGMVDFNGQKMTVEAFAMMLAGLLQGAVGPRG